jgi:hypothetical protein
MQGIEELKMLDIWFLLYYQHFLKDIEDGKHDGIPDIGVLIKIWKNPDIKRKYKILIPNRRPYL